MLESAPSQPTAPSANAAASSDRSLDFRLTGTATQRPLRNSRGVAVKLECPQERCMAALSGTITVPAKTAGKQARTFRLKRATVWLLETKSQRVRFRFSSGLRRHVARALGDRRTRNRVKVHVEAAARDEAVNLQTRKLTVRVRR